MPQCFHHVGTCVQLLSPLIFCLVCFKWHKCIVKRHTYLWGADKQPNTNTGVFFLFLPGCQGRSIVVILNTKRGTWHWKAHHMRMTRDNCLFQCECLSLAISSLPFNLKWGTGRRSGFKGFLVCIFIILTPNFWSTPRNSYCPRATCDKHSVPPYRGQTLWQISGSLFNHPVHSQSGQCILLLVHCISLLKTMTGNWECPHKNASDKKWNLKCYVWYTN